MSNNTGLIEMRDNLRKASDIIDEVLELEKKRRRWRGCRGRI